MDSSRRNQRGFTLLELLVVIGILGVLAAVVVIAVSGFSGQADVAACKSDERNIVDAEEVHHAETGAYTDEAGLVVAGRLHNDSSLHDVVLTADSYELVDVGRCATDDDLAAATVADDAATGNDDVAAKAQSLAPVSAEKTGTSVDGFGDGWIPLGAAKVSDESAVLVPEQADAAGAVLLSTPVTTDGLRATFAARSGKGGEGLAFVLIDPESGAKSLGQGGAGLGFAGLPGYAVTIDTVQSSKSEPPEPFLGIARGAKGLEYLDTTTAVPDLVDEWHEVSVEVDGSVLVVTVDGKTVLKARVDLPPTVLVGFTGATGESPARQEVAKVRISG